MDWESKLQRQRSCSCITGNGWRTGQKTERFNGKSVEINSGCDPYDQMNYTAMPRWRVLWKRLKKEKRRIFDSSRVHVPYDPYTYSQNFDQGSSWLEPEDLGRSFSARFANPGFLRLDLTG